MRQESSAETCEVSNYVFSPSRANKSFRVGDIGQTPVFESASVFCSVGVEDWSESLVILALIRRSPKFLVRLNARIGGQGKILHNFGLLDI